MVAILTKYLGPTNFRGARVKAYTETKLSVTVHWDHALNPEENHRVAAMALVAKMCWTGRWVGGATEQGYAFVCIGRTYGCGFTSKATQKTSQGNILAVRCKAEV
jgi:hypothetical protein